MCYIYTYNTPCVNNIFPKSPTPSNPLQERVCPSKFAIYAEKLYYFSVCVLYTEPNSFSYGEKIMKKRTLITKLMVLALGSVLAFTACTGNTDKPDDTVIEEDDDDKSEEEELLEIELSEKKVTIEAGETYEIEIENYDDLKKVKIEVEDEDIAEAEIDEEIITITGISEGKTTITVTAKDSEDIEISVKVTEPEIIIPEVTLEAGEYIATTTLSDTFWEEAMGSDGEIFLDFFEGKTISIDFTMYVYEDGTATMAYNTDQFLTEFIDYIDDEYIDFMKLILEYEGEEWDDSYEDYFIDNKDALLDELREELEDSLSSVEDDVLDLTWEEVDGTVTFKFDARTKKEAEIQDDGSFEISFSAIEIGTDMFGSNLNLHFYKR